MSLFATLCQCTLLGSGVFLLNVPKPSSLRQLSLYTSGRSVEVWDESCPPPAWTGQSPTVWLCSCLLCSAWHLWSRALTLIQLDTKCSCDLLQSLTVAVTSFLTPAPWRVNWKTVHDKLVTFHQSPGR